MSGRRYLRAAGLRSRCIYTAHLMNREFLATIIGSSPLARPPDPDAEPGAGADARDSDVAITVEPGDPIGAVCTANDDCDSAVCGTVDGESRCTQTCTTDDECPADFNCLGAPMGACWPGFGAGEGGL